MSGGPIVRVAQGELLGRESSTPAGSNFYSFLGIPYARPPVGSLRFKAPQNPLPWSGVRDATVPGSMCAQMDPLRPKQMKGSEDCLYLNVHTPKLPEHPKENLKLPVIVFVHGGRFQAGHGAYYKPDYLIDKEVIVVTINFRLNILGFLALGIPECPGNAALKDYIYALRWIKENISTFNGDKENLTVFGESAGAAMASSLIASPMGKGLCNKLILESGTFANDVFMWREDTVIKAQHAAKLLGKDIKDPKKLFDYLQQVSIEDLLEVNWEIMRQQISPKPYFSPVYEPIFEGVENFFPEDPMKVLEEGRHDKVPIIMGFNSYEGAMFVRRNKNGNVIYDNLVHQMPHSFNINPKSDRARQFCGELCKFYFNDEEINDLTRKAYIDVISDALLVSHQYRFLKHVLKYQENIWLFRFSYVGSLNSAITGSLGFKGATHSDQLPYHFYKNEKTLKQLTKDDKKVIDFFSTSWANFAKNSNPQVRVGDMEWRPVARDNVQYLDVDKKLTFPDFEERDRMEFWCYLYQKYGNQKSKL